LCNNVAYNNIAHKRKFRGKYGTHRGEWGDREGRPYGVGWGRDWGHRALIVLMVRRVGATFTVAPFATSLPIRNVVAYNNIAH